MSLERQLTEYWCAGESTLYVKLQQYSYVVALNAALPLKLFMLWQKKCTFLTREDKVLLRATP